MSLSEVGLPGQQVDPVHGGDVHPSGRLMSVTEIQQAFRALRSRPSQESASPPATPEPPYSQPKSDLAADPGDQRHDRMGAGWLAVVAAHAGAGASTIALALSDVLA